MWHDKHMARFWGNTRLLIFAAVYGAAFAALSTGYPAHAQKIPPPHKTAGVSRFTGDLPNFAVVAPGISRGGAPTPAGLKKLRDRGVRTVIDLRIEQKGQAEEEAAAKSLGLTRVRIRMGREAPTKKQTAQFLALMNTATPQNPIFIHCHYGADRTGAMVGIWRRTHDGWAFDRTYQEMQKYGFKPYLHELKDAVAACGTPPVAR